MTRSWWIAAALVVVAVLAGLAAAVLPLLAVAGALVFLGLAAGLVLSLPFLSRVVVVTSFLTRFRLPQPLGLLFEHGAALIALPAAMRNRNFRKAVSARPVMLLSLFIGWSAVITLIRSPDPGLSLRIVVWLALDLVVLVVLLVAQQIGENPLVVGVRTAGWVAAAGLVIWIVAEAGLSSFGTQLDPATGVRALYATAFEGNILGSLMAMWLFVILSGEMQSVRSRSQWLRPVLMLVVLLLSLARAAMLGLLVGIVVWQILLPATAARRKALGRLSVIGLFGFLAVMTIPAMAPVRGRVGELTDLSSGTGLQRVESWKTAIDDLDLESALTGLGTNSFGQRHLDPTLPNHPTPAYLANLPLQVLYDSGLVGFLLLAGVLLSALPRTRRSRARALGLFAVFLVSSLATSSLWFATTWIFLARGAFLRDRAAGRLAAPVGLQTRQALPH